MSKEEKNDKEVYDYYFTGTKCKSTDPKILEECIVGLESLRTAINPYNKLASVLQAYGIRDIIGIERIVKNIFIDKFNFDIEYQSFDSWYHDYSEYKSIKFDEYKNITSEHKLYNQVEKDVNNIVNNHTTKSNTFINYGVPHHVCIHYLDNKNKKVYIYEPHMKEYWYILEARKAYEKKGYTIGEFSDNILEQGGLPLCSLYVLHFFLYIYVNDESSYKKFSYTCDDIYIMNFTRYILKLCHIYGFIPSHLYYLLTNNGYQLLKLLKENDKLVKERKAIPLDFKAIDMFLSDWRLLLLINKYNCNYKLHTFDTYSILRETHSEGYIKQREAEHNNIFIKLYNSAIYRRHLIDSIKRGYLEESIKNNVKVEVYVLEKILWIYINHAIQLDDLNNKGQLDDPYPTENIDREIHKLLVEIGNININYQCRLIKKLKDINFRKEYPYTFTYIYSALEKYTPKINCNI
jgi:hypothetical protein